MTHTSDFQCRRCGVPTYEWGALCRDCMQVVSSLGETRRWASDYSRAGRSAMTARLRSQRPGTQGLPYFEKPVPRRDRPARHEPLPPNLNPEDEVQPEWRRAAERTLQYLEFRFGSTGRGVVTHSRRRKEIRAERTAARRARIERQAS